MGLISPCRAEFACPVVLTPKKDNTICMCVHYRALNKEIEGDAYPMRDTRELLCKVSQAKFISCFDLKQGYYQLPLSEDSKILTAFNTGEGIFYFNVMPFGIKDAPAAFQRFADLALSDMPFAMAYLDDFAVLSANWEEHMKHIRALFNRARQLNVTFNIKKCQIGLGEVKYLGHVAGSGSLKSDPEKLLAIAGVGIPKTKKTSQSFVGSLWVLPKFLG